MARARTGSPGRGMKGAILGYTLQTGVARSQIDGEKGRFLKGYGLVEKANQEAAERLQATVVAALDESMKETNRPRRPTDYLRVALASPDAVRANLDGFTYLPAGYIESSPAGLYYRAIEFGLDAGFVGRILIGTFNDGGGEAAPISRSPEGGQRPLQAVGGPASEFRSRVDYPSGSSGIGTIRVPIKPHHYLESGLKKWQTEDEPTYLASLRAAFTT